MKNHFIKSCRNIVMKCTIMVGLLVALKYASSISEILSNQVVAILVISILMYIFLRPVRVLNTQEFMKVLKELGESNIPMKKKTVVYLNVLNSMNKLLPILIFLVYIIQYAVYIGYQNQYNIGILVTGILCVLNLAFIVSHRTYYYAVMNLYDKSIDDGYIENSNRANIGVYNAYEMDRGFNQNLR